MSQWRLTPGGWRTWQSILTLIVVAVARQTSAAQPQPISWHSDVNVAWKSTQKGGRLLLVFVTAKNCGYCTKMKQVTYADPAVADVVNRSFVPLVIDAESANPLVKELAVTGYPATFIISPDALILDRLDGYVSAEKLMNRLATIRASPTGKEL
jgi:uncharacterized protein YyaL (SSP411 family)